MTGGSAGSHLDREIAAQPEVLRRTFEGCLPLLDQLGELAADVTHVVIAGRGSSDNAARYAQYLLGLQHGLPVGLATPSLLTTYGAELRLDGALAVAVSQSGRSPDVVAVLEAARAQGRPAVAVTNDPDSPLARAATAVLPLAAGEERAVAATGTYTASLLALAALSTALRPPASRDPWLADLDGLPDVVAEVVAAPRPALPARLAELDHLLVVGRGLGYGTAFEVALKVRELSGVVAEGWSPPDLLHGPIGAVGSDAAVLLVAHRDPATAGVLEVLDPVRERGAMTMAISGDAAVLDAVDVPLPLAAEPPSWLAPVAAVVPGQVLARELAAARGRDLDRPEGLTKVTETR